MQQNQAEPELDLDGSTGVLLAPVAGPETRRDLGPEYFQKRPAVFVAKFAVAVAIIAAGWVWVALQTTVLSVVVTTVTTGLMYAHLVELQHECLHEHAFRTRKLNRLFGFVAGLPMFSSYSHYKYDHLRHHAFLGTPQNREFFNYQFHNLDSPLGFVIGAYNPGRYANLVRDLGRSLVGRTNPNVTKTVAARRIRTEYQVFLAVFAVVLVASIAMHSLFFLWVWILPSLLVAEPTHFLIELPEHYGLNTQTDPNVLTNTRTVRASRFGHWFTNGNDLHTAHHFHQGVPMVNVPKLHQVIKDRVNTVDPSFVSFYSGVVKGRIRFQGDDKTCMTR
ncbi:MAG: fatty acid desaturase [Actinobacteria bacterium]|nr:fatty acid desaturase [Actinomycetota bacterium]